MKKLAVITSIFSIMNECGISLNDLNAYSKNQTETENQSSQEQEPSSDNQLPLEVLYSDDTRSFFFEVDKTPVAIICDNIGFAFEDAPKAMSWRDAQAFCEKYSVGGLKWSLPNKESGHLDILYKNKEAINVVLAAFGKEPLKEAWYWSSSEYLNGNAWGIRFSDGGVDWYYKGYNYGYVRLLLLF